MDRLREELKVRLGEISAAARKALAHEKKRGRSPAKLREESPEEPGANRVARRDCACARAAISGRLTGLQVRLRSA